MQAGCAFRNIAGVLQRLFVWGGRNKNVSCFTNHTMTKGTFRRSGFSYHS